MKYRFIKENQHRYEIGDLCEAIGVKRSSFYRWKENKPSVRSIEVKERIAQIHHQSRGRYGYRPIYYHLKDEGIDCGRDCTLRLMNEMSMAGVQKKRLKPSGTESNHRFGYSANLLRDADEILRSSIKYG